MRKFNLLFVCCFFIFLGCGSEDKVVTNTEKFETFIEDEIVRQKIPALSVLIFKNDEILYEKYFGYSDIEAGTSLEDNDLFLLASVSKLITASALLQLYDDREFDLDEPINSFLPFDIAVPNYETDITFRMLLTHTSGIRDNWDIMIDQIYEGQDSPNDLETFLKDYLTTGGSYYSEENNFYDFEPNTSWAYSNIGNALIAVLVENISGLNFNDYCKQNIFEPLGMTNTFWHLNEISETIAIPYYYEMDEYKVIPHYTFTDYPNGGLRSTAHDLHIFLKAYVNEGTSNGVKLLESATVASILSSQIPSIYGEMGLHMFYLNEDRNLWGHSGGDAGVATIVAFNPENKLGVVLLTNNGSVRLGSLYLRAYDLGSELD